MLMALHVYIDGQETTDPFVCQCIASNLIGFFLYIAAGSMVVWSYSFEIDESANDTYREGA